MDGALGPVERVSVLIIACDEAFDMRHEFLDTAEGTALQRLAGEDGNQISIWFSHEAWVGV